MNKIASGRDRDVYDLGDNVLKIERTDKCDAALEKENKYGRANDIEYDVWQKAPEKLKQYLAPVKKDEHGNIIQRKGLPAQSIPETPFNGLCDMHKVRNYIVLDGKTVICDYGHIEILNFVKNESKQP